jgi:hypothetical protein
MSRRTLGGNARPVTRAEEGHLFERLWRRRIYEKFKSWRTVTLRLGNGDLLTSRNLDQKAKGPDLTLDVEAKTEAAGRRTANKIVKELRNMKRADPL